MLEGMFLPPTKNNYCPLNPKHNNNKIIFLTHFGKAKLEGIFGGLPPPPPQNYCPLNPKHSNEKGSSFPSNHLFNVFQGVEVFALKLFVDNLICY